MTVTIYYSTPNQANVGDHLLRLKVNKSLSSNILLPLLNLLLHPQGQIIDVKCEKSQKNSHLKKISVII